MIQKLIINLKLLFGELEIQKSSYFEDMASASIFIMNLEKLKDVINKSSHINIGFGSDISIAELARTFQELSSEKLLQSFKEDGTTRKIQLIKLKSIGWKPRIK